MRGLCSSLLIHDQNIIRVLLFESISFCGHLREALDKQRACLRLAGVDRKPNYLVKMFSESE